MVIVFVTPRLKEPKTFDFFSFLICYLRLGDTK